MGIDPPIEDDVFDGDIVIAEPDPDPGSLDRQWVTEEAAATFGRSRSESERWVEADGVLAVYAHIQAHWAGPPGG